MSVFSIIARTDPSEAAHGESQFQYLDRVAGRYWDQVRDLIEDWFSRLCTDAQKDVRGRLRDRDDRQFTGAFFELYLHECLLRMGYAVTCHPKVEGTTRRPDFLAQKDSTSIYFEARSTSLSDIDFAATARRNAVYQSLDKLNTPNFFLWIDVVQQGNGSPGVRQLRRDLENWLTGLDPDDYGEAKQREDFARFSYEEDGWGIEFHAIPKTAEARGKEGVRPLGIFGPRGEWLNDQQGIRSALATKGSAYGQLGAPFVVAVASNSWSTDDWDVRNALYGTDAVQIRRLADGTDETTSMRLPDGYWYAGDHWAHRGVSAVLVVKQLHPALVGGQQQTIWEHPDPEIRVGALPIWRRSFVGPNGHIEFQTPQSSQAEWFGLGSPWPVGEPFPE
ncbi:hypothetical protein [Kribbella jejuensis]|uniref:hypothetical protein n=1 Tax=Kribbella jejuensis TaxID=236068 RepID=UPI0011502752|nr:hypothetical protein [Kribbella jejuensis]